MVKNQFGVNIKRFRSDIAKDYFNQVLIPYFQKEGIVHESLLHKFNCTCCSYCASARSISQRIVFVKN
jgi:hypothetical protein